MTIEKYLHASQALLNSCVGYPGIQNVEPAIELIVSALEKDKPLLVCGNGGSASDALHITGELVGRFMSERRALNCICLSSNVTTITAWANDYSFDTVFARQVEAHGKSGGVLLGISTSGHSTNVIRAFEAARKMDVKAIALTGEGGGQLASLADILIDVPSRSTAMIQQVHICVYHYLCQEVERKLLG